MVLECEKRLDELLEGKEKILQYIHTRIMVIDPKRLGGLTELSRWKKLRQLVQEI